MKIELKSIHFSESLSEETNAFTANLYIDGKKVGYCRNDGRGGCTYIHGFTREDNQKIQECNEWCKQNLPKTVYDFGTFDVDLEHKVDLLLEEWLKKKDQDKIKKKFKTCIVIGVPNGHSYSYWNLKRPLKDIPKIQLQGFINKTVKPQLVEGKEILNDNLIGLGVEL